MKILMIAQYFPPDFGGASTRAYNIAKGLVLKKNTVFVLTAVPHYPDGNIPKKYKKKSFYKENIDGIFVYRVRIPSISHSTVAKRVFLHFMFILTLIPRLTLAKKVDIVFSTNPNFFSFFPSWLASIFFRKPIVRNVDDLWPEVFYDLGIVKSSISKKFLNYIAKISYEKPKAITLVSHGYVKTLVEKYKIPKEKITVIEHGVDLSKFKQVESINNDITTIMYSGALSFGYDFEIIIKCAKLLESKAIHFVVRGRGELVDQIKNFIQKYNVTNVIISTEFLSQNDLNLLLNEADIFLLPMSQSKIIDQGLPTKILEYQAIGKPIVCISSGEAAKYIQKTNSGVVTDSRDPKVLSEIILNLIDNPTLAKELGNNGYENIVNNLTLEKVGERFDEVFRKVLKKS